MAIDRSTLGPIEILAVAFHGNEFTGEIRSALQELVDGGVIRILDLAFVRKSLEGEVTALKAGELEGNDSDSYKALVDVEEVLVRDGDLADAAQALEPGNSAAILVWEDRWATRLVSAIRAANGEMLSLERVPREAVDDLLDSLKAG